MVQGENWNWRKRLGNCILGFNTTTKTAIPVCSILPLFRSTKCNSFTGSPGGFATGGRVYTSKDQFE